MSIDLVTEPGTGAPITAADYTAQNGLISANEVPKLSILTVWESVGSPPAIKQGTFIRHAGNTYKTNTSDEAISETPVAGVNYIELTLTGTVITAEWVTDLTGYAYNPAYGGIYNAGGNQLLSDVCYLDSGDYYRGKGFGQDFNFIYLANGSLFSGGAFSVPGNATIGGDLTLSGSFVNPLALGASTTGTQSVPASDTVLLPAGIYEIMAESGVATLYADVYLNGSWRTIGGANLSDSEPTRFISDGTNSRLRNTSGSFSRDVYWRKF